MAAIHGLDQSGPDQGLDVLVQRAARGQAKGLAEFIEGRRMIEMPGVVDQVVVDLALSSGQVHGMVRWLLHKVTVSNSAAAFCRKGD